MAAKSTSKKKRWFVELCENGCQICGTKFHGQKKNGLKFAHIISKKIDNGTDEKVNCLALCPNCADVFDVVIKPAIYDALEKFNNKTVPASWKDGEGRRGKLIDKDLPSQ